MTITRDLAADEVITSEILVQHRGHDLTLAVEVTLLFDGDGPHARVVVFQDDAPTDSGFLDGHPSQQEVYTIASSIAARRPVPGITWDAEMAA